MKRLIPIISVLVLALILSFTPACGKAVPAEEVLEEEVAETTTEAEEDTEEVSPMPEELSEACIEGNLEEVERLLGQGVDIDARNDTSWTALMLAANTGQTEVMEMLINNGADINAKDNVGLSAMKLAEAKGHTEIVNLLKAAGAQE